MSQITNLFDKAGAAYAEKDYKTAFELLDKLAKQGHAPSHDMLGLAYSQGCGVDKDCAQAIYWHRKAADQGNVSAYFNLGTLYYQGGNGIEKNSLMAFYWWLKAALQGHARAQNNIASMYKHGIKGIEKSYSQALSWYAKAANQNNPDAQYNLGLMYYKGQGVVQDAKKAASMWIKAAEHKQYKVTDFVRSKLTKVTNSNEKK
jgi:TPR repeat protein